MEDGRFKGNRLSLFRKTRGVGVSIGGERVHKSCLEGGGGGIKRRQEVSKRTGGGAK